MSNIKAFSWLDMTISGHYSYTESYGNDVSNRNQMSTSVAVNTITGTNSGETLTGTDLNDELLGLGGDDILEGLAGDDILNGGTGADQMKGGLGDDTYVVDNINDQIAENDGEGTDTIQTSRNDYILGNYIENLTLTGSANTVGTGNGLDNVLIGNTGNNTLNGLAGSDTLDGGKGADILKGGTGDDIYIVDNVGDKIIELTGEGIDSVQSSVSYSLQDTDGKGINGGNVENLSLTGKANINATGNALDNVLTGNDGNNALNGAAGNDTLDGKKGSDIYLVDAPTDHTQAEISDTGSTGIDEVRFAATVGDVTLHLYAGDTGIERVVIGTGTAATAVTSGKTALNIDASAMLNGLTIIGNSGANSLIGTDYADFFNGGAGDDNLTGGLGNDTLDGGIGIDTLNGGEGDDTYLIDNTADAITDSSGIDTVKSSLKDYTLGIDLENLTLIGSARTGTGNNAANILIGNAGNNALNGAAGSDKLDGGKGADTLTGGADNDTYVVDNIGDKIIELGGGGIDTVESSISYSLLDTDGKGINGGNVENLTLTGNAKINAIGNVLDNVISGNSGNNVLNGAAGNDTLDGKDGSDIYLVTALTDYTQAEISDTGSNTDIDEVRFAATTTVGDGTLHLYAGDTGIERVVIGTGTAATAVTSGKTALNIDASAVLNGLTLVGNAGINELKGTNFGDTLDGGAGIDTLNGGDGDDTYVIDNTADVIIDSSGSDTVKTSLNNYVLRSDLENLTLFGSARIGTGNDGNNIITGNAGSNTLTGGKGDDTYVIDNTSDMLIELNNEGIDTVQSSVSYSLEDTDGKGSNGGNIENLTLIGNAKINATGNALNNIITGNNGNNVINGGVGNDTLDGREGSDVYLVSALSDYTLAEVADTGSTGIDEVRFTVSSTVGGNTLHLYAGDTGIERVVIGTGTAANAVVTGTSALNIDASAVLNGLTLVGNAGANSLKGTDFNDTLDGGVGGDVLNGGLGDDTYVVDHIGDSIIDSDGIDTVKTSLNNYILSSNLENLTLIGNAKIGNGNAGDNVITGNAGANVLNGNAGTDIIDGGAGSDIYLITTLSDYTQTEEIKDTGIKATDVDEVRFADTIDGSELILNDKTTGIERVVIGEGNAADAISTGTTKLNVDASAVLNGLTLIGNSGDNTLTGTIFDDTLNGGVGVDTLNGGAGNDTYILADIDDTIIDSGGTDTVQSSLRSYILGTGLENLLLLDGALNGTGNDLANVITGNTGNNTLDGGNGADTLIGGMGDDMYLVDITSAGAFSDTVTEAVNAGTDSISVLGTSSNLVASKLTLGANVENLDISETGTSKLNLTGNALKNTLIGNSADNVLNGGAGNDILTGGTGKDTFAFSTALNKLTNIDTITDFKVVDDTIQLSKSIFTTLVGSGLSTDDFYTGSAAHDANDHIIYNSATGVLYYDSDGTGTAVQVQIVTLTGLPALTIADFTVV